MDDAVLAKDAQPNATGLRASDKGFLNMRWREYLELLSWTAIKRCHPLSVDRVGVVW
jgi:hypothetical protein